MANLRGAARLFFVDQSADKAVCLAAIEELPADPDAPLHREAVTACLAIIAARVAPLRFQGKGTPQMLLSLLRSQLDAGNKGGALKVVNSAILDRRPRSVVRLLPLLLLVGLVWVLYQLRGPLLAIPWLKVMLALAVGIFVLTRVLKGLFLTWGYWHILRNPHMIEMKAHHERIQELLRAADDLTGVELSVEAEARYLRISELARAYARERSLETRWITAASEMLSDCARRRDLEMLGLLLADAEEVLARPGVSPSTTELANQVQRGATAYLRI